MKLHLEDDSGVTWLLEDRIPEPRASILLARAKALDEAVCEIARRADEGDTEALALWHSTYPWAEVARRMGLSVDPHVAEVVSLPRP